MNYSKHFPEKDSKTPRDCNIQVFSVGGGKEHAVMQSSLQSYAKVVNKSRGEDDSNNNNNNKQKQTFAPTWSNTRSPWNRMWASSALDIGISIMHPTCSQQ